MADSLLDAAKALVFGDWVTGKIGTLSLDATLSSEPSYTANPTEYPIEDGSVISDHIHIKPMTLSMDGIVVNKPIRLFFSILYDQYNGVKAEDRVPLAKQYLIKLFDSATPFTVVTEFDTYKDMVFVSLSFPRDPEVGESVKFKAKLQHISIVSAKVSNLPFKSKLKAAAKKKNAGKCGDANASAGAKKANTKMVSKASQGVKAVGKLLGF